MIGQTIGTYRVLDKLGEGGIGEVYRPHDSALGRTVAIKMLPARTANAPAALSRCQREAQLLAALNQPNVGAIYGLVQSAQGPALVLEFIDGPTLSDIIARAATGIPIEQA